MRKWNLIELRGKYTCDAWIILCMRPANERFRYAVKPSLIGWVHTHNDPWWWFLIEVMVHILIVWIFLIGNIFLNSVMKRRIASENRKSQAANYINSWRRFAWDVHEQWINVYIQLMNKYIYIYTCNIYVYYMYYIYINVVKLPWQVRRYFMISTLFYYWRYAIHMANLIHQYIVANIYTWPIS